MKLFRETIDKQQVTILQKVNPVFITTDGIKHIGYIYKWANKSGLSCSVEKYIMININSDGYIQDENDIMYLLTNVISIKWNLIDEIRISDKINDWHSIYFNDEEVSKLHKITL